MLLPQKETPNPFSSVIEKNRISRARTYIQVKRNSVVEKSHHTMSLGQHAGRIHSNRPILLNFEQIFRDAMALTFVVKAHDM